MQRKIAVGAFNTANLEGLEAILGAAEELGLPVIAQFAQCHENLTPLEVIGLAMVYMAKRAAVPVCVHLDHGETLDYLKKALDIGFTSIMYDGSVLPYDENLKNTRLAVEMAGKVGASVEAELGSMGRRETGSGDTAGEDETKIYTDPELAGKFAAASSIDALACSFGTTRGIYLTEPRLDFSAVSRVRSATGGIPVVMHGGSGFCQSYPGRRAEDKLFHIYGQGGRVGSFGPYREAEGKAPVFLGHGLRRPWGDEGERERGHAHFRNAVRGGPYEDRGTGYWLNRL